MVLNHSKAPNILGIPYSFYHVPLFFFISGYLFKDNYVQLRKRSIDTLIVFYVILFLVSRTFDSVIDAKLFQVISVGIISIIFLYRFLGVKSGFLFPVPFLLFKLIEHYKLYPLIFDQTGWLANFLFPLNNSTKFSLFPWLSFIILGILLYQQATKNLIIGLILSTGAIILFANHSFQKFNMGVLFFVTALFICIVSLLISRFIVAQKLNFNFLSCFGRNSLIFVLVHLYLLFGIFNTVTHPLFLWTIVTIFSYLGIYALTRLNKVVLEPYFKIPLTWVIFFSFLIFGSQIERLHDVYGLVSMLVFSLNYKSLFRIINSETLQAVNSVSN